MTTDKDLDGWQKNLQKVKEGWNLVFEEWNEANSKVADAIKNKDIKDALHHSMDYLGAILQHAWRTHLYIFVPKWFLIGYLIAKGPIWL